MIKKIFEIVAVGFTAVILFAGSPVLAQQKSQPQQHVVESGETLYSIAQQYHVTVQDLMKWNHLNSDDIQIGQQLLVTSPEQKTTGAQESSAEKHMVKRGETLFSIAKDYGVSVDQLKSWNDLQNNALHVGQIYGEEGRLSCPDRSAF
jgi:membrane-bound lytic murein transglycosylase D